MSKRYVFILFCLLFVFSELESVQNNFPEKQLNIKYSKSRYSQTNITADWTSYYISSIIISPDDGFVDEDWKDIPEYNVEEFTGPSNQGWIKSVHDDFFLYVLIAYPKETKWISIELNATDDSGTSMAENNDGWAFGTGVTAPEGSQNPITWEGDIYFISNAYHPVADVKNDVIFEYIIIEDDSYNYVEFRRSLNTNDLVGFDLNLAHNDVINIKFASSLSIKYHKEGGQTYTFAISSKGPKNVSESTAMNTNSTNIVTSRKTPQEIKLENEFEFLLITGFGFIINIAVIIFVFMFPRKK